MSEPTEGPGAGGDAEAGAPPALAVGLELIGEYRGSGFQEAPYLIRRSDGQVLQVPRLLYLVASELDGVRDAAEVADRVSAAVGRRLSAGDVRYLVDQQLVPAGIVAPPSAAATPLPRANPLLALRFRAPAVPRRAVQAIAGALRPLFLPPVVVGVLGGLVALDAWLLAAHGIGAGARRMIEQPGLFLPVLALLVLGGAFHECGHAAACRYGGARPGAMGVGIYLIWPAFYTDVTDCYRLGRAGRLRTDLGGVYFNAVFCLMLAGGWLLTGFEPLLVLIAVQQLQMLGQFTPWLRLDGYYIVGDLTGVPDVFARMRPILRSLIPGRPPDPRAAELTPRARRILVTYLVTAVPVLLLVSVRLLLGAPHAVAVGGRLLSEHAQAASAALEAGEGLALTSAVVQTGLLLVPVLAVAFMLARTAGRVGRAAVRR